MSARTLSIGDLASRGGCSPQGVRYYEQLGLLPAPTRTSGNQRRYRAEDVRRLTFIRHSRELGFSVEAIRELLALGAHPDQPCHQADAIANAHLANIRSRIERLRALERELERMLACAGDGAVHDCRVIESLADHDHCLTNHGRGSKADPVTGVTAVSA